MSRSKPSVEEPTVRAATRPETGLVWRVVLVIALAFTLVGAMRWALNVTNANARQVSKGITRLQTHFDEPAPHRAKASEKSSPVKAENGPSIDAAD